MLNILLTLCIHLAPAPAVVPIIEEPEIPAPDPAVVQEATEALELAFKKGKSAERKQAIEEHGDVEDEEVIQWLAKGLKDKDVLVQAAAVEALRWLEHPTSLRVLHQGLGKEKSIKKNDSLHEAVIKAIGQHGSPTSIEVLMDGALASAPRAVTVARIYSLGKIRDKESVEALMDLMQKTGRASKRGGASQPLMQQLMLSLEVLTHQSLGKEENVWQKWWRDNKSSFEVSEEPPKLAQKNARIWQKYWAAKAGAKDGDGEEPEGKKKRRKGDDADQ